MNVVAAVISALTPHTSVKSVQLVGSRANCRATEASDWDFLVETTDFAAVARDLAQLVECLHPIAQQWDRLSEHNCYMLILPGPVKIDLIFAGTSHEHQDPWEITRDTLPGVDAHFWDWTLWLASKQTSGQKGLVGKELAKMWIHLLRPLGIQQPPHTVEEATTEYLAAREQWEQRLRVSVPRDLEREILPRIRPRGSV